MESSSTESLYEDALSTAEPNMVAWVPVTEEVRIAQANLTLM